MEENRRRSKRVTEKVDLKALEKSKQLKQKAIDNNEIVKK